LDVQTAPAASQTALSPVGITLLIFAFVWETFFALEWWLPYLKNDSMSFRVFGHRDYIYFEF
jgi:hypothetical protein